MDALWQTLNERQRTYLRALYACDQTTEAERRQRAARGVYDRTPANEWRWQLYGPVAPPSDVYRMLQSARLIDPGTGSTRQALEARGLVSAAMCRIRLGCSCSRCKSRRAGGRWCVLRQGSSAQAAAKGHAPRTPVGCTGAPVCRRQGGHPV